MSLGTIIAIVIGVILAIIFGLLLGMFVVINYMTSPKGFVKDLTGNEPPPTPSMPNHMLRVHIDALNNEQDETK